jgi:hypothetical protein
MPACVYPLAFFHNLNYEYDNSVLIQQLGFFCEIMLDVLVLIL